LRRATRQAALLSAVPLLLGAGAGPVNCSSLGYNILGRPVLLQTMTLFTTSLFILVEIRLNASLQPRLEYVQREGITGREGFLQRLV
jgi:hypothetical protein